MILFCRVNGIKTYLKTYSSHEALVNPLHSIYSVSTLIIDLARKVEKLGNVNLEIFTPILKDVVKKVAFEAVGAEVPAEVSAETSEVSAETAEVSAEIPATLQEDRAD